MKFLLALSLAASALSASAQDTTVVVFSVDMNGVDTFDRAQDELRVAGNFQDPAWQPRPGDDANVLSDPDSNGVFSLAVPVATADFEYKYLINNWNNSGERASNEVFGPDRGECVRADEGGNINRIATVDLAADTVALETYVYDSCTVSSRAIADSGSSSARAFEQLRGVRVLPNPMRERTTVMLPDLGDETFLVRVFSADGREALAAQATSSTTVELDRAGLTRGLYLVDVTATAAGQRAVLKLLVE